MTRTRLSVRLPRTTVIWTKTLLSHSRSVPRPQSFEPALDSPISSKRVVSHKCVIEPGYDQITYISLPAAGKIPAAQWCYRHLVQRAQPMPLWCRVKGWVIRWRLITFSLVAWCLLQCGRGNLFHVSKVHTSADELHINVSAERDATFPCTLGQAYDNN